MTVKTATLRLAKLRLETRRMLDLARRRRLPLRDVDEGYLIHSMLGELFGAHAPSPFAVTDRTGGRLTILAYTDHDAETLRGHAAEIAPQWLRAGLDLNSLDVKELPTDWPSGHRMNFVVRVCPVVRTARGSTAYRPGAEVDAFIAACNAAGPAARVDRFATYRSWFASRVPERAARLTDFGVVGFQLNRLVRRTHDSERRSTVRQRPDVTIAGALEIVGPPEFESMLRHGIGRHRAFGFGMVLLRPHRP